MADIFDYIEKNGQLNFNEKPFTILDGLVFAGISYLPFIIPKNEKLISQGVLKELIFALINDETALDKCILRKRDPQLARYVLKSSRYSEIKVFDYVERIDEEADEQFSALTFLLEDGNLFIAFSGTDSTIVGWKENLNMSFVYETSGQASAVEYVQRIAYRFPSSKIMLGGHSKGGNLAVYAGAFIPRNVQDRILQIYNFDGPGFLEETTQKPSYLRIKPRITTIIPRSSIVGTILEQTDSYIPIHARGVTIIDQHLFYNWKIEGDNFVVAKNISEMSIRSHYALRHLLSKMSFEEREKFVNILGRLANSTEKRTLKEIRANAASCTKEIMDEYKTLTEAEKKLVKQTFLQLALSFVKGPK